MPIVKNILIMKRQKSSEVGTIENELQYSVPNAPDINSCTI